MTNIPDTALISSFLSPSVVMHDGRPVVCVSIQVGNDAQHSARVLLSREAARAFRSSYAECLATCALLEEQATAAPLPVISAPAVAAPTPEPASRVARPAGHGRTLQLDDLESL